jgi:hypothetical protein
MVRYWLAGAAAFGMTTGVALAQSADTTISTQSTTSTTTPLGSHSATRSKRTVESDGTVTDKTKIYRSGSTGTKATTNTRTTTPDGSQTSTYRHKQTATPGGATTTNKTTTRTVQ